MTDLIDSESLRRNAPWIGLYAAGLALSKVPSDLFAAGRAVGLVMMWVTLAHYTFQWAVGLRVWLRDTSWRRVAGTTAFNVVYFAGPVWLLFVPDWPFPVKLAAGTLWVVAVIVVAGLGAGFVKALRREIAP